MRKHLKHDIFKLISNEADRLGVEAYVIGGFVRDIFLKRASKDVDILVIGNGVDFATSIAKAIDPEKYLSIFKNFGTAMLKLDDLEIEFVGARKESYRSHSRKPIVEEGTLSDDQLRRDFTINAMAIRLNNNAFGELIDPFNGLIDIEYKRIRTPQEPSLTYSDDPLRMMRAIRFAAQLHFEIDPTSLQAITDNRERIKIVSGERIAEELNKIILSKKPSIGFELLFNTGLLHIIFPEMVALQGIDTINGKSHKDNFYHTLEVLDNVCKTSDDLWLRWAAILHDIAKPPTKRFDPVIGWTFHGHEDKGARMVPKIFRNLKLPLNEKMKFVQKLVQLHLRPIVLAQSIVTDSAVRRLLFDAAEDIDALMQLCHADVTTKNEYKKHKYKKNFELVQQKLKDVEERDQLRNWQPAVTGDDIMQLFQLKPGKEVGMLKNLLREAILEGQVINDREAGLKFIREQSKKLGISENG